MIEIDLTREAEWGILLFRSVLKICSGIAPWHPTNPSITLTIRHP